MPVYKSAVTLPGDPTASLHATPKQYVDGHAHTASDVGAVPTSRTITTGSALTGGGDLTGNRILAVDLGTGGSQAAAGNHTHTPELVPHAVQTLASSTTLTMNASLGKHFRCSALAANTTVADPTNKTDGQPLILDVVASAATRTISLNAAIVNMSAAAFPISLPSGKRWVGGFLITGSTALLLASAVQP